MLELSLAGSRPLVVLALGAHADDIELGCGGTVLLLRDRPGVVLHHGVLTGTPARAAEAAAAAAAVSTGGLVRQWGFPDGRLPAHWGQVKDALEDLAREVRPDVVLAPRPDDAHQDHRTVAEIVPTVWRDALVLGYEIPKIDGDRGRCNLYVPLSDEVLERKWQLLHTHFPSQHGRGWFDREVVAGSARLRGVEARTRYAEGFLNPASVLRIDEPPAT